ncbi:hypothetical protein AB9P05_17305 [Roseivirga sp. BDSF3-8]|uniref:hypothetical protein n=1 Tax=Roseivirga sp. BDSF3-8 TaxID=3241598 RepID=UPI0035324F42
MSENTDKNFFFIIDNYLPGRLKEVLRDYNEEVMNEEDDFEYVPVIYRNEFFVESKNLQGYLLVIPETVTEFPELLPYTIVSVFRGGENIVNLEIDGGITIRPCFDLVISGEMSLSIHI